MSIDLSECRIARGALDMISVSGQNKKKRSTVSVVVRLLGFFGVGFGGYLLDQRNCCGQLEGVNELSPKRIIAAGGMCALSFRCCNFAHFPVWVCVMYLVDQDIFGNLFGFIVSVFF